MYKSAHLFFLSPVEDEVFKNICEYSNIGFVETFKEVGIMFIPCESQVFSLDDRIFFSSFFDVCYELNMNHVKEIAKKIVSLCSTLGVIPLIRYRRAFIKNLILAQAVQQELKEYENFSSANSRNESDVQCQFLVLDRGFDCISPLVHEFTFQAMAYDILNINDDVYAKNLSNSSETSTTTKKEDSLPISLTEDDETWCRLRHEHIANVGKALDSMKYGIILARASESHPRLQKLPELGDAVRKHLITHRNVSLDNFRSIAGECMTLFCRGLNILAEMEQSLALGKSAEDKPITNSILPDLMNILASKSYETNEKLRVLLLYIFFKKGIPKQIFFDILSKADLSFTDVYPITNALHLDIDIFRPGKCNALDDIPEAEDTDEGPGSDISFKQSRWVPLVKTVMLRCIQGELSHDLYPFLEGGSEEPLLKGGYSRSWCADGKREDASKLIFYIVGGVTYSEMRCAYEVMKMYPEWDIFIGGDTLITPNEFLERLGGLSRFFGNT
ncbi:protein ROP-like [Uloborus diversus]|uniref:protein ROP-like n=1 Tax=Uloborus diversus TaxID=327109 RepID=UPI002409E28A|nr:protein ROP-like [Uloborus diversus]